MGNLKFYNLQLAPFTNIPNPGFLVFSAFNTCKKSSGTKRLNPLLLIFTLMGSGLSPKMPLSDYQSLRLKI